MHSLTTRQLAAMTPQEAHQAPVVPFTIEQAHRIMQFHVACRVRRCPRKAAAQGVLVTAGKQVLAVNRPR
ncbi:hypothetical protein OG225_16805 [Nocardia sp. NBC_01377]